MDLGWYSETGHISYDGHNSASVVNWYSENGIISGLSPSFFPPLYTSAQHSTHARILFRCNTIQPEIKWYSENGFISGLIFSYANFDGSVCPSTNGKKQIPRASPSYSSSSLSATGKTTDVRHLVLCSLYKSCY